MAGGYASLNSASLNSAALDSESRVHVSKLREIMAACALLISIFGFVLQTEALGYVGTLGYQKPMIVMYVTHSCMSLLLPLQFLIIWAFKKIQRGDSFMTFSNRHAAQLKNTALLVVANNGYKTSQLKLWLIKTASILAVALNFAGASWYIAVNMTTTADLTAIYNCSTFFAYGFSVWILKERLNLAKLGSVLLSIIGVFIIAYLGSSDKSSDSADANAQLDWRRRTVGNTIIAVGTILYGLYEVLYKKIACTPQKVSARRQAAFANFIGASIGVGTLALMWPLLIFLHFANLETFEIPSAKVAKYLVLSVIGNVSFSGAFLVLMSLTSPVLGSVSSLLATCMVPLVNYIAWRQKINFAEIIGGLLIIGAFGLLTWASLEDFEEEEEESQSG